MSYLKKVTQRFSDAFFNNKSHVQVEQTLDMIKSIDNIRCDVKLIFNRYPDGKGYNIFIVVVTPLPVRERFRFIYDKQALCQTPESEDKIQAQMAAMIDTLFNLLNSSKFSKYFGEFQDNLETEENPLDEFEYLCNKLTNLEVKYNCDNCCVCLETTKTMTQCKHYICLPCFSQLKDLVCPVCREDLDDGECSGDDDM